jgi:very-short-patch-repair endonuclease
LRADSFKTDTKHQLLINGWIVDIGIGTVLEQPFGAYSVDIFIPDLDLGIEVDGPYHLKKRDLKRDEYLKQIHGVDIWRIPIKRMGAGYKDKLISRIMLRVEEWDR